MQSEGIHNKWVNVIAIGVSDVTSAFINSRVGYIHTSENVGYAEPREIKNFGREYEEAVRVLCVVRVTRRYTAYKCW